jgi:hypothetical protein
MTRDDIIRMAREQGLSEYMQGVVATFFQIGFEEGVEAEREACARVPERLLQDPNHDRITQAYTLMRASNAIRARGQG